MLLAAVSLLLISASPQSTSSLLGDWMTPNHSIVHVYSCDDTMVCLRLVAIGPKDKPSLDVNNPVRSDRSRALCGLEIGSGFTPDGSDHARDGHVYDPESGKTYSGELTASGDTLKLRGYVGISLFGRTETWRRTHVTPSCG